jgi:hypothetical protein
LKEIVAVFLTRRNHNYMTFRDVEPGGYNLYVKIDGEWQHQFRIDADSHSEAFRLAMFLLEPQHFNKPIRLEQEDPEPVRDTSSMALRWPTA